MRTARFDGYRVAREHNKKKVREAAQKKLATLEKEHAAEKRRIESRAYKKERESGKEVVNLKEEVESLKTSAEKERRIPSL